MAFAKGEFDDWAACNGVELVMEDGEWWLVREEDSDDEDDTGSEYESVAPGDEEPEPVEPPPRRAPRRERVRVPEENAQSVAFAQTQLAVACGLIPAGLAPTALLATGVGLKAESLFTSAKGERPSKAQRRTNAGKQDFGKVNHSRATKDMGRFKQRR